MNKFTFYGNYSKALALTCMLLANNGYSAEEKDSFSDDEGSSTCLPAMSTQDDAAIAAQLARQFEEEARNSRHIKKMCEGEQKKHACWQYIEQT